MKYKQKESLKAYFLGLFSFIALLFIIATSNTKSTIVSSNTNTVKAIESSRIISLASEQEIDVPKYLTVFSTNEIKLNQGTPIEFTGTITGYGPDCDGCSGIVGCPPYQNVLNNNIYYKDDMYGTIRILAADPSIPCGSIIKVSNYDKTEFIGIVLDRGRDIKGLTMDLLFDSENTTIDLGRKYNINFKIERWGF